MHSSTLGARALAFLCSAPGFAAAQGFAAAPAFATAQEPSPIVYESSKSARGLASVDGATPSSSLPIIVQTVPGGDEVLVYELGTDAATGARVLVPSKNYVNTRVSAALAQLGDVSTRARGQGSIDADAEQDAQAHTAQPAAPMSRGGGAQAWARAPRAQTSNGGQADAALDERVRALEANARQNGFQPQVNAPLEMRIEQLERHLRGDGGSARAGRGAVEARRDPHESDDFFRGSRGAKVEVEGRRAARAPEAGRGGNSQRDEPDDVHDGERRVTRAAPDAYGRGALELQGQALRERESVHALRELERSMSAMSELSTEEFARRYGGLAPHDADALQHSLRESAQQIRERAETARARAEELRAKRMEQTQRALMERAAPRRADAEAGEEETPRVFYTRPNAVPPAPSAPTFGSAPTPPPPPTPAPVVIDRRPRAGSPGTPRALHTTNASEHELQALIDQLQHEAVQLREEMARMRRDIERMQPR